MGANDPKWSDVDRDRSGGTKLFMTHNVPKERLHTSPSALIIKWHFKIKNLKMSESVSTYRKVLLLPSLHTMDLLHSKQ